MRKQSSFLWYQRVFFQATIKYLKQFCKTATVFCARYFRYAIFFLTTWFYPSLKRFVERGNGLVGNTTKQYYLPCMQSNVSVRSLLLSISSLRRSIAYRNGQNKIKHSLLKKTINLVYEIFFRLLKLHYQHVTLILSVSHRELQVTSNYKSYNLVFYIFVLLLQAFSNTVVVV